MQQISIKGLSSPITVPSDWVIKEAYIDPNGENICFVTPDLGTVKINTTSMIIDPFEQQRREKRPSVAKAMINGISQMVDAEFNNVLNKVNDYSNAKRNNEKIENRFYLPNNLFEAVDFTEMGIIDEPKDYIPNFVKGEKYALSGVSCEGFEMPEKVYELVGIHDEYDGIALNSVIVKQVSGLKDKIYTLSKNDCDCMGIEYEEGLQLFPKHLNWKRVKEVVPFDKNNLGTTPLSDIDNTIRYVLLKVNGFKDYIDGYVMTPSGKLIKEKQFEDSIKIVSNEPLVYEKPDVESPGYILPENKALDIDIVYPKDLIYNHGNFISSDDTIYILVKLVAETHNPSSIDGQYGVESAFLDGFNPNEHFMISWDELGAYTVEEYEAEKARKEKLRKERIAKAEQERRKKIEEEEKRIKDFRKRTEEAVERMKGYKIELPTFPKMPKFSMENGLSSLNLYMDGLDLYFGSLDKSLSKLTKDLGNLSDTIGINLDKRMSKNKMNENLFDLFKL